MNHGKEPQAVKRSARKYLIGLLAFALGVAIFAIVQVHGRRPNLGRNFETGPVADVRWVERGQKFEAVCCVKDRAGTPLKNVEVHVMNNSGGGLELTDTNGVAVIRLAEPEVTGVRLNGLLVLDRPNALWAGSPSVDRGIDIQIVVKDTNAIPPKAGSGQTFKK